MHNYQRSTNFANRNRRYAQKKAAKALLKEQLGWVAAFILVALTYVLVAGGF